MYSLLANLRLQNRSFQPSFSSNVGATTLTSIRIRIYQMVNTELNHDVNLPELKYFEGRIALQKAHNNRVKNASSMKNEILFTTDSLAISTSERWWQQSKQTNLQVINNNSHSEMSNDILDIVRSFLNRIDNDLSSCDTETPSISTNEAYSDEPSLISTIDISKRGPTNKASDSRMVSIYRSSSTIELLVEANVSLASRMQCTTKSTISRSSLIVYKEKCIELRTCSSRSKCRLCAVDGLSNRHPSCPLFNI